MLLTTGKAARLLGISIPTVRRLVSDGQLSGCRMTRQLRVDYNSILQFGRRAGVQVDPPEFSGDEAPVVCLGITSDELLDPLSQHPRAIIANDWFDVAKACLAGAAGIVCDLSFGRSSCKSACMRLHMEPRRPRIVAIGYADEPEDQGPSGLWDKIIFHPVAWSALRGEIELCHPI